MRAQPAEPGHSDGGADNHGLEGFVDVHAFTPERAARLRGAPGLDGVKVRGEELLANWFGWANRTLEATADPEDDAGRGAYAFRGYLLLQQVDRRLLEPPCRRRSSTTCSSPPAAPAERSSPTGHPGRV